MVERGLWHPVATAALVGDAPVAARLLDESLVLWRDAQGGLHAWSDRCSHRGAALSRGRIVGGRLECPYHGWQFDAQARCTHVPAVPAYVPGERQSARAFEVTERYGLAWVRLAPSANEVPAFEPEDARALRKVLCGPYEVETSAPRLVENFLDMAHFGFVHAGWLGDPAHASIEPYPVEEPGDRVVVPACHAWQPQAYAGAAEGTTIAYRYEVRAPYFPMLVKRPDDGQASISNAIAMFICPVEAERSVVWFRMATVNDDSSDDALRAFQDTIFLQDKPVVESQRPKRLPLAPEAEAHGPADRVSAAYRRFLRGQGITFGVC